MAKREELDLGLARDRTEDTDQSERLTALFGRAPAGDIEQRVSKMVQDFVGASHVVSDISLRSLRSILGNSEIPSGPSEASDYMQYLADSVVAHSVHTASPRFIGHMTSALPSFLQPLGRLMIAMNQNNVKIETAKATSCLEREALAMMHRLIFNFPEDFYCRHIQESESTLGVLVSGGTLANVTAMWCARNSLLGPQSEFKGVENEGLAAALHHYGYQGAAIIGSSLMHYSFEKTAGVLGIGTVGLIRVPVDHNHRIDLLALRRAIQECRARGRLIIAIVGIAGTTDSGAVDPLLEMAEIAHEAGVHFHVDAAWGGPLLFSARHRHKLRGIEACDSVTIDGHKQLYLPMGIGMLMLRDPQRAVLIEKQAHYIVRRGSMDLGRRSLEGSRAAMAIFLHAALSIIGRKGYEFLIDEGIRKAQYMKSAIQNRPEFELMISPDTNILTYRYIPDSLRGARLSRGDQDAISQFNKRLHKTQRQAGRSFVSRTTLTTIRHGSGIPLVALRAVISNPLTTEADIDAVLDEQAEIGSTLQAPVRTPANELIPAYSQF
jgi:glutamate decarboxylase